MELIQFIPHVLILIAAFLIVGSEKWSARNWILWLVAIILPHITQAWIAGTIRPNPLTIIHLDWFVSDTFGWNLMLARYVNDVIIRTLGAIVGIVIVKVLVSQLRKSHAKDDRPSPGKPTDASNERPPPPDTQQKEGGSLDK